MAQLGAGLAGSSGICRNQSPFSLEGCAAGAAEGQQEYPSGRPYGPDAWRVRENVRLLCKVFRVQAEREEVNRKGMLFCTNIENGCREEIRIKSLMSVL